MSLAHFPGFALSCVILQGSLVTYVISRFRKHWELTQRVQKLVRWSIINNVDRGMIARINGLNDENGKLDYDWIDLKREYYEPAYDPSNVSK